MSPVFVKGKAIRQTAQAAARRWRRLTFADLLRSLSGGLDGSFVLPIATGQRQPSTDGNGKAAVLPSPLVVVNVTANHPAITDNLRGNLGSFWHLGSSKAPPAHLGSAPPLVARDVSLHAGSPVGLGLPEAVEIEKANWCEAVMRGEAYSYNHYLDHHAGSASPPSPVRWLTQQMLDGFVSCRAEAHAGVTTAAALRARETARHFGRHVPPFAVSPYYGASELLDRWCLFGDPDSIHQHQQHPRGGTLDHVHRVLELSLASALLPSYGGVWLNASVVAHRVTGDAVVIFGPPSSGKTTLALHCLGSSPDLALVAAERVLLCPAANLPDGGGGASDAPQFLLASVPWKVGVGIGAVLGTLRANPFLTSHLSGPASDFLAGEGVAEQLLRNTDGVLWRMAQKYVVDIDPDESGSRWMPAVISRLRGAVLLDWSVAALDDSSAARTQTVARQVPPAGGGVSGEQRWEQHVDPLLRSWGAVRDHYLLRSVYDAESASLARLLGPVLDTRQAPAVVRLEGAVDFHLAVRVVRGLFGG